MRPPWHPLQQPLTPLTQSTRSCSEKEVSLCFSAYWPSSEAMVENAQQEPHCAWFLTGLTMPFVRQSTEVGRESASILRPSSKGVPVRSAEGSYLSPLAHELNSSAVWSANWFTPFCQSW